jgi:hypothetical protein
MKRDVDLSQRSRRIKGIPTYPPPYQVSSQKQFLFLQWVFTVHNTGTVGSYFGHLCQLFKNETLLLFSGFDRDYFDVVAGAESSVENMDSLAEFQQPVSKKNESAGEF